MSDTSKTPESKTYKPILYVHPFYPTFSIKEVPEGEAPKYQVKFNQAYVYYHSDDTLIASPIEISGMSSSFELGDDAKKFYVQLVLTDGSPTSAAFMEGDLPDNDDDNKYFFVCEIEDFNVKSFKLRENIHWSVSEETDAFEHPFKIETQTDEASNFQWRVLSELSSLTEGTNGDEVNLAGVGFDAWNTITSDKYIVLQANVSSGTITSWSLDAVDIGDTDEVGVTGSPPEQNKIRLLIGKVEDTTSSHKQAINDAQRITYGFLNGSLVQVFESAPTHADDL